MTETQNLREGAEHQPFPEIQKPSARLMLHIAHGEFDASAKLPDNTPTEIHQNSLTALRNQNTKIREDDTKRVEALCKEKTSDRTPTTDEIRQMHFQLWKTVVLSIIEHDLHIGDKTAQILRDKLHFPLTGEGEQDSANIAKALYNEGTTSGGSFYEELY